MTLAISCPICGERNGYEFRFGGEEKGIRPDDGDLDTPESWFEYVHMNKSIAGVQEEWWCHRDGCGTWFMVYRDTRTIGEVPQHKNDDRGDA